MHSFIFLCLYSAMYQRSFGASHPADWSGHFRTDSVLTPGQQTGVHPSHRRTDAGLRTPWKDGGHFSQTGAKVYLCCVLSVYPNTEGKFNLLTYKRIEFLASGLIYYSLLQAKVDLPELLVNILMSIYTYIFINSINVYLWQLYNFSSFCNRVLLSSWSGTNSTSWRSP